jgi:hypothetical protein
MPKPAKPLPGVFAPLRPPATLCQPCGLVILDERRSTDNAKLSRSRRGPSPDEAKEQPIYRSLQKQKGLRLSAQALSWAGTLRVVIIVSL